jgi:hypothetical protein
LETAIRQGISEFSPVRRARTGTALGIFVYVCGVAEYVLCLSQVLKIKELRGIKFIGFLPIRFSVSEIYDENYLI